MSDLRFEDILKMLHDLDERNPFRGIEALDCLRLPVRPLGLNLFEAPPPPPVLSVRDIKFDDGTSILSPEFRASLNSWLVDMFGFQEDLFKDKIYILGGHTLVASHYNAGVIRTMLS